MVLEDIDSQVGTGGASNGVCEFIHQFADISTPTLASAQESCPAKARDFTNFIYEVQMKIVKGDGGGIAYRIDPTNDQFYYFAINQDGSYSVAYTVGISVVVLAHGFSSAIHQRLNQTNLVAAVVHGQVIELYVNLKRVAVVGSSISTHGEIGVIVTESRHQTEVIFQNAKVWKL